APDFGGTGPKSESGGGYLGRERRVAVRRGVAERGRLGELGECAIETLGCEVPDPFVVPAEFLDDRGEPRSALQRQLDFDRDPLTIRVQDGVGQVATTAVVLVSRELLGDCPLALPFAEAKFALEQEPNVGYRL